MATKVLIHASVVFALCSLITGCGSPVSAENTKEFSETPLGVWFLESDPNVMLQIESDGSFQYNGVSGTYTTPSAGQMAVKWNGQDQTWNFKRQDLSLEITFPDNSTPVKFIMQ